MLVQLEQKHIDEGKASVCAECPVALSIAAVLKPGLFAEAYYVGGSGYFNIKEVGEYPLPFPGGLTVKGYDKQTFQGILPLRCVNFMISFDTAFMDASGHRPSKQFKPFDFGVEIPPEFLR